MKSVYLETSSEKGSVAVFDGSELLSSISWDKKNSHAELATDSFNKALQSSGLQIKDLTRVGVGVGPGSFTGIRVALVLAKSLAYSLNIDLYPVDSLKVLGTPYLQDHPVVLTAISSQKNQVFTAVYKKDESGIQTLSPPQLTSQNQMRRLATKHNVDCVVGSGIIEKIDFKCFPEARPEATAFPLAIEQSSPKIQSVEWAQVQAFYLQKSRAEEVLEKKVATQNKSE